MGAALPIGLERVAAVGATQPRDDSGLIEHRRAFGPIDAGKKAGLTSCRKPCAGAIEVTHVVVAFVLFEKPTPRKRIPSNRQYPAAAGFDFPLNPALIDKVDHNTNGDRGQGGDKDNAQVHESLTDSFQRTANIAQRFTARQGLAGALRLHSKRVTLESSWRATGWFRSSGQSRR